jgi:hypothetical protein
MWAVSVLGQSPRELREGAVGWMASPDGTYIAFSPLGASDNIREIWVMGSQGDNPRKVLAVGENETLQGVRWSPDAQRLAYIREPRSSDNSQYSIETCDLKGASRTVVIRANPGLWLQDFGWLPEGRIVYAQRESPSSSDDNLWQIGIRPAQVTTIFGKSALITIQARPPVNRNASPSGLDLTFWD